MFPGPLPNWPACDSAASALASRRRVSRGSTSSSTKPWLRGDRSRHVLVGVLGRQPVALGLGVVGLGQRAAVHDPDRLLRAP